jgi:hypothetical protein
MVRIVIAVPQYSCLDNMQLPRQEQSAWWQGGPIFLGGRRSLPWQKVFSSQLTENVTVAI